MSERYLPGYVWDRRSARYRVLVPGQGQRAGTYVARDRVLGVMESKIEEGTERLQNITEQFRQGNLSAEDWQVAFTEQLKTLYLQQAALGAGGWDRLTKADFGRLGGHLRAEYRRLEGFAQGILDETISELQGAARSAQYAGKARGMYFYGEEQAQRTAGMSEMKRVLGRTDAHCPECLDYAAEGWVPINSQSSPGTHPSCFGNCLCHFIYR